MARVNGEVTSIVPVYLPSPEISAFLTSPTTVMLGFRAGSKYRRRCRVSDATRLNRA